MNIPSELRDRRQWVNWDTVQRGGKPTKIPFQPSGTPASSTNPETWSKFDELADGKIGFVFTQEDPYIGIDLDGCRDPKSGKLDDWAREIVLKLATYAEVSPSETGVKLFGVTDSVWKNKNKVELDGDGHGGKKPGIEVYDCSRYFAVTGKRLKGMSTIRDVTDELAWLTEAFKFEPDVATVSGAGVAHDSPIFDRATKYVAKMEASISGSRGHDACFKAACALVLGFNLSSDEAYSILSGDFNARCQPPWSERELRHKVNSASKQPGQRGYLADAKPEQWSKIYVRSGPAPRLEEEVASATEDNRSTLAASAFDYVESLLSGKESLLSTGVPLLDQALGGGVALGEMLIIAARPSHGKSAIALQMVHDLSAHGIGCLIISEEMSRLMLGKRTIQFATNVPEEHWATQSQSLISDIERHFATRVDPEIVESCGTVDRVALELIEASERGLQVGVIDYVQLLNAPGKDETEKVLYASKVLRRIANQTNMLLIVLAQMNREIEQRKSFRPSMSDIKQTGQIEQDADCIVFGIWPHRIDSTNEPGRYQFFVCKNRNRSINSPAFEVVFEPSRQRLIEQPIEEHPNYHSEFGEYATA